MADALERTFRDEWARVLATLIGFLGDFQLAEEAAQEAFATAAERWPRDGVPANPGAWLLTTARNRAIDRLRRERTLRAKTRLLEVREAAEDTVDEDPQIPDERLELVFMCCHPALAIEAQGALTLRAVAGLTNEEIGPGFLVPGQTAQQRGDRPGLPGPGRDDEAAADPRQVQDQGGRHPVRRPGRVAAAGAARRGP